MSPLERSRKLVQAVDALTLRERLFILAAMLLIVGGLWEAILAAPLAAREAAATSNIEAARERLAQLDDAIALAAQGIGGGMSDDFERLQILRRRVAEGQESVRIFTSDLVDPAQMRFVLEDLIGRQGGLDLVSARNLEVLPLIEQAAETAGGDGPMLYQHGLVLELEGGYLEFLAYLDAVAKLPWQLYWSRLDLETIDYPKMRFVLELHTLSLEEEWIGV
jgi:MSHA biogenesis protein MshJ